MRSRMILGLGLLAALFAAATWWGIRPEMVQVEHRRVETKIKGSGSPAVVFENDFAGNRILWRFLQDIVAKETLTLTYERAGFGQSEMGAQPRSAEQIARELRALLTAEQIPPPYVLVGYAAGGLYMRVFAHMYPNDIAGLVFIDPGTEAFYDRSRAERSAPSFDNSAGASGAAAERQALPDSLAQARRAWPLPRVPTVLFSSGTPLQDSPLSLVAAMAGSTHIVMPKTDHLSILKEKAAAQQILLMVDAARAAASRR
jgi:pimeloyl-ACP methyl ester carboxylesterase